MKAYERVQKSLKTPKTLDEIIVGTGLTVYYIGRPKRGLFERILKGRWK